MKHYFQPRILLRREHIALLFGTIFLAITVSVSEVFAQRVEGGDEPVPLYYVADNPVISLKGGGVYTYPKGKFPSLLIGETVAGTGEIPAEYAETGSGYRLGVDGFFPFGRRAGLLVELSSQKYEVKYKGDSTLLPTRMEVQTFQFGIGGEVNLWYGETTYPATLRAIFLSGLFDFGFGPLANRVTGSSVVDTASLEREEATGSFVNNDPFRTSVALKGSVGVRIGVDQHLELMLEGGYSLPLNPVFSSGAIRESDLELTHLFLGGGLGFRF
ncbi:MAG: hypothetical protein KDD67_06375 [Ignavibacteriae bacterium]|nr:hypothetical protein [Ignavibacteriota bacterium]MCB9215561.1 hypothetical protein [Ignavibacteria bacterium]